MADLFRWCTEFVIQKEKDDWFKVIDKKTGLKGWVLSSDFSRNKPESLIQNKDYTSAFIEFKEKLMEMSASIEDAIGLKTFVNAEHLGGVAAIIIADDGWFKGRRHQNQAFQVYEIWRNQNQSPSFLSFRDSENTERFIILSGPHKPRLLKATN